MNFNNFINLFYYFELLIKYNSYLYIYFSDKNTLLKVNKRNYKKHDK